MDELAAQIQALLDAYAAAVYAKDVDAFAAIYDPEVVVLDAWDTWSYIGIDSWRGVASAWFGSLGDERVGVEFDVIQVAGDGDMLYASLNVTYKGLSAEDEVLRSMQNRMTWVVLNRDGAWKVLHEHSSAPADFETKQVMLRTG